ncbi:HAD hydrolase family protein [candidate division WOR-3 bacterium]|nr:HAD hydrolase family protein [candidate division WOR-3 bacterium]
MLSFNIPGVGKIELENAVFDLNGTIAVDGKITDKVKVKLNKLSQNLRIYLLTADTYGTVEQTVSALTLEVVKIPPVDESEKKRDFVLKIGKEKTVAIGNGANDALMLKEAKIGIAVIESEGASGDTLLNADLIVRSSSDAMDLLLNPMRIVSTLRR